jgi:RNA methyltransferase, TrmH family
MKCITSRDNARFKQLKKLAEFARERRKTGRTLLDGAHLLASSLAAGLVPELVAVCPAGMGNADVRPLLKKIPPDRLIEFSSELMKEISPVETPTGVIALIEIPRPVPAVNPDFCLLLEDVQDPGNLGSILRSAAAAGVRVAWLSAGCCDAWSPRVLRGGMGAHFALEIVERVDLAEKLAGFSGLSLATSLQAEKSLYDIDLTGTVAFLVGNEGAGLSPELAAAAGERVTIPMPGRVESLNVAAAAAICLFERVRQMAG